MRLDGVGSSACASQPAFIAVSGRSVPAVSTRTSSAGEVRVDRAATTNPSGRLERADRAAS